MLETRSQKGKNKGLQLYAKMLKYEDFFVSCGGRMKCDLLIFVIIKMLTNNVDRISFGSEEVRKKEN